MYLPTDILHIGLQPLEKQDIPALARHANNPQITGSVRDRFPSPYTEQDTFAFLEMQPKEGVPQNLAITDQDHLIGMMGAIPQGDVYRLSAELGYWFSKDYWGKGIVTMAIKVFVSWAFALSDIVRLYANVFSFNPASRKVLEKAGFTYKGVFLDAMIKGGRSTMNIDLPF